MFIIWIIIELFMGFCQIKLFELVSTDYLVCRSKWDLEFLGFNKETPTARLNGLLNLNYKFKIYY